MDGPGSAPPSPPAESDEQKGRDHRAHRVAQAHRQRRELGILEGGQAPLSRTIKTGRQNETTEFVDDTLFLLFEM